MMQGLLFIRIFIQYLCGLGNYFTSLHAIQQPRNLFPPLFNDPVVFYSNIPR